MDQQLNQEGGRIRAEKIRIATDGVESICETILLLAHQGLALRGHDDNEVLDPAYDYFKERPKRLGNFNALLSLKCLTGDERLKTHLSRSHRKFKFVTAGCQNEIISLAGKVIQERILARVHRARFYSILADETGDVSKREQFSLVLRYSLDGSMYEDFLGFVDVTGCTTGKTYIIIITVILLYKWL